ncbi:MAG: hypothetical protein HYV90_01110 [Candidatus Woesebacteria bacterium]|nr:MAG: hypothetical protein HYV90_01110 [Candidatus Woesebacteria bacterium]
MSRENDKNIFNQILKAEEKALSPKRDPLWEAHLRFLGAHEIQLKAAEQIFLETEPTASLINAIELTADAVKTKEWFAEPAPYFLDSTKRELKKTLVFDIEILDHHGDGINLQWEKEAKFALEVENGKELSKLLRGFKLSYDYHGADDISIRIAATKDDSGNISAIQWGLGRTNGNLEIKNSDVTPLLELFAKGVAQKKHIYHSSVSNGGGDWDHWSIN